MFQAPIRAAFGGQMKACWWRWALQKVGKEGEGSPKAPGGGTPGSGSGSGAHEKEDGMTRRKFPVQPCAWLI